MKVLIVGGVAGGASAAVRIRRLNEKAEIIIFERGEYISFANCGLPYYIGGTIKERDELILVKPSLMKKRFNIEVRLKNEVININKEKKEITILNQAENIEYIEKYDKLVLSPGAAPVKPPIPGINSDLIFSVRDIPDTDKISNFLSENNPASAVIIGGGFIGLEMAENLHQKGLNVSVVELSPQVMPGFDSEMAEIIHENLQKHNIKQFLNDGVSSFREESNKLIIKLNSGKELKSDIVITAIGVRPEIDLAKNAGLKTAKGIIVNKYMQTSDDNIYAVGDAVEFPHVISGVSTLIPLAWPANQQGRIAANNICNIETDYTGSQGTAIVKIFELTAASTGLNEKSCKVLALDYEKSYTHSMHHAGYYPGAAPLSIKLIFNKIDRRILGGQVLGTKGVDKRIDVISTAIKAGMKADELCKLDLAYAPPFSSAKDPVIMAGMVAENILNNKMSIFHWHDIPNLLTKNIILIDVRTSQEFERGHIEGAINIPVDELRDRIEEIKDKTCYIYCQVGLRGYIACRILDQCGFKAKNLSGGYKTYQYGVKCL